VTCLILWRLAVDCGGIFRNNAQPSGARTHSTFSFGSPRPSEHPGCQIASTWGTSFSLKFHRAA
jgi:hypothetical protein